MTKITDYSDQELEAVETYIRLHIIESGFGRKLTDEEVMRFIDTFNGQWFILKHRLRRLLASLIGK